MGNPWVTEPVAADSDEVRLTLTDHSKPQRRFTELDGFRGLAALGVVVSHFTTGFDSRYGLRSPGDETAPFDGGWGAYGVQLFFLISGFVILMSAQRAKHPSDFVVSRISRLYPAYWIAVTIAIVITIGTNMPHTQLSWTDRLLNFAMVQRWFLIENIDNVYWTLAIEMQFYVLIFLLLLCTRARLTDRVVQIVGMIWLTVSVAVALWAYPTAHGLDPQLVPTATKLVLNATLAEWGPLFVAGMFAFLARERRVSWALPIISAAVAVLNGWLIESTEVAIAVVIIAAVFLFVTMREQTRILTIAPLKWFGKISYSLYITHQLAGFALMHVLLPITGRLMSMAIAFGVVTLLAWGVWWLGEDQGSRAFRALLKRWQHSAVSRREQAKERKLAGS